MRNLCDKSMGAATPPSVEYLDARFPRYTKCRPAVPVWSITPHEGRTIHRFFNSSPVSPSGRFVALFRLPYENREPDPGDEGEVILVDLLDGSERILTATRGWETQLGANVQWGGDDHELFFNDVDVTSWTPFGVRMDPFSGTKQRLSGCVFSVSPDGSKVISADQRSLRRIQAGYGVVVPDNFVPARGGITDDDGIYVTDCCTGVSSLIVTTRRAVETMTVASAIPVQDYNFYIGQCHWNTDGSLFWFQLSGIPKGSTCGFDHKKTGGVIDAIMCATSDGSGLWTTLAPELMSSLKGNHPNWVPGTSELRLNLNTRSWSASDTLIAKAIAACRKANGRTLKLSAVTKAIRRLLIATSKTRFMDVNFTGHPVTLAVKDVIGSGHPTTHRSSRFLVTDAYWREAVAFQDGTVPIRLIDLQSSDEKTVVRIRTETPWETGCPALRCDPHAAWGGQGRFIVFNGFEGGTRRVYLACMDGLLDSGVTTQAP